MPNILATGISKYRHLNVFDQIIEERFNAIDLNPIFVYLIDTVPASALYALADQLGVLAYGGWKLATTEEQQRELIRTAIALQSYKGTPYGIKQSIKSVGFFDATITEGGAVYYYNGEYNYNGAITYGSAYSPAWPCFSVEIDLGNYITITQEQIYDIIQQINEYKNERSWLTGLFFRSTFEENQSIGEQVCFEIHFADINDSLNFSYLYNGLYKYDGTIKYSGSSEEVSFIATEVDEVNYLIDNDNNRLIDGDGNYLIE